jgi:cysteine desulfurase/selenocysteine lyase
MAAIAEVNFIVTKLPDIGVIAFKVDGHHNHDIATSLDTFGIAVRSGHHCAMPLMASLKIDGCIRVSLSAYNTYSEVDYFIECLQKIVFELAEKGQDTSLTLANDNNTNSQRNEILAMFSKTKSWDSRHREIMMLGKKLIPLDQMLRDNETLIAGCESLAWLRATQDEQGKYTFESDSDAKIIRGLLVIVLSAYNNMNAEQIHQFDIESYFSKLGLIQHLSPSRGNGLLAIVEKIKSLAT